MLHLNTDHYLAVFFIGLLLQPFLTVVHYATVCNVEIELVVF